MSRDDLLMTGDSSFCFSISLLIKFSNESERLLVCNDALVGLLKLGSCHSVDVGSCALFEALWERHFVEQVTVEANVSKVVFARCGNK